VRWGACATLPALPAAASLEFDAPVAAEVHLSSFCCPHPAGRKGMYADAFELPPSQSATPAKARGKKGASAVAALAELPSKSPGKRTRTTRHSLADAPPVGESPAKKLRSSGRV
jgi:hypothetical protein